MAGVILGQVRAFGGICVTDNLTPTTITTASVLVQYTHFGTNEPFNNAIPDHTNDHITIGSPGPYAVIGSVTVESIGGPGSKIDVRVKKNNGAEDVEGVHFHRDLSGGGGEQGSGSISGIAEFGIGDTVELWIGNVSGTESYLLSDVNMFVESKR